MSSANMSMEYLYKPMSWSELLCQCLPVRNNKPSAEPDIEMQNFSSRRYPFNSTHFGQTPANPVVPGHVVRANHPDNTRKNPHDSWWLRDDSDGCPSAAPSRSGARNPVAARLSRSPGPAGMRTPPRCANPYLPPPRCPTNLVIAANTPDMFVHDSNSSPEAPAPRTPDWDDFTRVSWTDAARVRVSPPASPTSVFRMSGALPDSPSSSYPSSPIWELPPSSIFYSDEGVHTPDVRRDTDARIAAVRFPRVSPRAASYAAILDVQTGIDARRSRVVSRAAEDETASPPSPTSSVDSIDFFSSAAGRPDFGERIKRSGGTGTQAPVRPARFTGTSPYVA
ncbi:hypothetical protein E4T39_04894 [Aureobasidium subglaciale]|nr:hypothetical protein E4T39_04894 [Aureobasidium subglaciale]